MSSRKLSQLISLGGRSAASIADQAATSAVSFVAAMFIGRTIGAEALGMYAMTNAVVLVVRGIQAGVVLEPMSVFGPQTPDDRKRMYFGFLVILQVFWVFGTTVVAALAFAVLYTFGTIGWPLFSAVLAGLASSNLLCLQDFMRRQFYVEHRQNMAMVQSVLFLLLALGGIVLLWDLGVSTVADIYVVFAVCSILVCSLGRTALPGDDRQAQRCPDPGPCEGALGVRPVDPTRHSGGHHPQPGPLLDRRRAAVGGGCRLSQGSRNTDRSLDEASSKCLATLGLDRISVANKCEEAVWNINTDSALVAGLGDLARHIKEQSSAPIINSKVHFEAGERLYRAQDFSGSIPNIDNALAVNPLHADAYRYKALALQCLNQHDAAVAQYAAALTSASVHASLQDTARTWNNKGVCLMHADTIADAIRCFDHALAIDCRDNVLWLNKALALRVMGLQELAEAFRAKVKDAWDPEVSPFSGRYVPRAAVAFRVPPKSDVGFDYYRSATLLFYKYVDGDSYADNMASLRHDVPDALRLAAHWWEDIKKQLA